MGDTTVDEVLSRVAAERVLSQLREVSAFDRYQASAGLGQAADRVAGAAADAGLADVTVRRYPADGQTRWWSFAGPLGWTPRRAGLQVSAGAAGVIDLDHARDPCAVATYSAPTAPDGIHAPLVNARQPPAAGYRGAIIVADRETFSRGSFLADLAAAGALGFVTDAAAREDGDLSYRGRVELPPGGALFAFSLTPDERHRVAAAADRGARAQVLIEVDRSAPMAVVSGVIPGERADEVWLTAHLCHPRPGANDNASGVAALLGTARLLTEARRRDRGWGTRQSIRFHWGPEYLGTAAALHERVFGAGAAPPALPTALINLDMVGEDQQRCQSPFVVERPPDTVPSLLAPLAEDVVGQVFARTAGSSGTWSAQPFLGFSDHALLADPALRRPAVQFCHPADRFNHSAADSVDKVSAIEMVRAIAAGAALAQLVASGGPSPATRRGIVDGWCRRERDAAARLARAHPGPWGEGLCRHVARVTTAIRRLAEGSWPGGTAAGDGVPADGAEPGASASGGVPVLRRHWSGPFNVRAMTADLPAATRTAVTDLVAADKRTLSLLFNFGIRADGSRSRDDVISETSYAMRRPLTRDVADGLLDALIESGWVSESAPR